MSKVKAAAVKSPKKNVTQNKKVTPQEKEHTLYSEALEFHSRHPKGKVALDLPKPLTNQRDLSLAYSPGVAAPCLEIHKDPEKSV
jgi:malate dehydrogenase (oxaloacetate-decarboxylating)(NADP+)